MYGSSLRMETLRPRALSSRPMLAAVMPFPSEEVTPPVTKTYFDMGQGLPGVFLMLPATTPNRNPAAGRVTAERRPDWVAALLAGEWRECVQGRVRVHPYKKWGGAHWRLVSLAELGVTVRTPGAGPALDEAWQQVFDWLLG